MSGVSKAVDTAGRKLLVVGWSGADWAAARPLLDAGQLPALATLLREGCAGAVRGFAPWSPAMLWGTVATGVLPDRHGIWGEALFDEQAGAARMSGPGDRRAPAFWNLLEATGRECAVLGWPGTYPAESLRGGVVVTESFAHAPGGEEADAAWLVPAGAVSPAARAEDLAELRLRPCDVDTGLIGLFVPKLREIDQSLDRRPAWLLARLAELYTMHNVAVVLAGEGQPDLLAVQFPFLAEVEERFGIFQAPRHPAVGADECAWYGGVVASAYRLLDVLLADLIKTCDAETAVVVVSTHGFARGTERPEHRPQSPAERAAWHRSQGLLAMRGPGVRSGGKIEGARLEDVAPTLLAWAGVSAPGEMAGRVLGEFFTSPPSPSPARSGVAADEPVVLALAADEALWREHRRLLGRLAGRRDVHPGVLAGPQIGRGLNDENQHRLGIAMMALERPADALVPLHRAFLAEPESQRRAFDLAVCLLRLGLSDELEPVLRVFLDQDTADPRHRLARAVLALNQRGREPAREALVWVAEVAGPQWAEHRLAVERAARVRLERGCVDLSRDAAPWSRLIGQARERLAWRAGLRERTERNAGVQAELRVTGRRIGGDEEVAIVDPQGGWSVRTPWMDELPRMEREFSPALRHADVGKKWIRVLVAGVPERIVGVLVLSELAADAVAREGETGCRGRIDVELRAAWVGTSAGDALLDEAARVAETAGLKPLALQARVEGGWGEWLRRRGFIEFIRHETWLAKLTDMEARHRRTFDRILKRWPVRVFPLEPERLEQARDICERTGLMSRGRLEPRSAKHPNGVDSRLCFAAGSPERPVAVVLGRMDGAQAWIDVLARDPAGPEGMPTAVHALLERFVETVKRMGCLELVCSVRPGITPSLVAHMKAAQGRLLQAQAAYRR